MCYTCGCKLPYDDHGDPDNITEVRFEDAGETEAIDHAGKVKAKENMIELLQVEIDRDELEDPKPDYNHLDQGQS